MARDPKRLSSCPDCGHDVSRQAEACPNCGCPFETVKPAVRRRPAVEPDPRPARRQGGWWKILLGVAPALLLAACVLGMIFGGKSEEEVFANDVIKAYDDLAEVLESVKDPGSAKNAAVKINEVSDRLAKLIDRAKGLTKVRKGLNAVAQLGLDLKINEAKERVKKALPQANA